MGTVRKRGETWRAEIARKGERESKTFATRREAVDWIAARESQIKKPPSARKTFADAADRYIEKVAPQRAGERWETLRLTALKQFDWAQVPLDSLTTEMLADWRDERLKFVNPKTGPIGAGTVLREMGLLRAVLEYARREWKWIAVNPLNDVRKPPRPPDRKRIITDEERDAIVAKLGGVERIEKVRQETAVAFLLALETAMRAGEIVGARWKDLNGRTLLLPKTKNGDQRTVPLSKEAVRLLGLMRDKALMDRNKESDDRIFHIDTKSLDVTFRRARVECGLSGFTFHDSRATALTRLADKLEPLDLAKMVGHRDLKSLMIYYRPSADAIAERLG